MSEETRRQRLREIDQMREEGIEPYPYRFEKTHWAGDIKNEFSTLENSQTKEDVVIRTAGRVVALRSHGKSFFFVLRDDTG
ncbi:MAG TPA: lysine--tRNA ligase, partial [Mesotoga infera]|nr:lysine--tRNA ligase [Mesotoga infera]